MPALNLPKREAFAQLVASGKSFVDAYIESRPRTLMRRETAHKEGSVLAKQPDIAARIAELQKPVIERVRKKFAYSLDKAMEECEAAEQLARAMLQPNVMLQATTLKAKLQKMLVNVSETRKSSELDDASTEELVELLTELRARKSGAGNGVSNVGQKLKLVT